MRILETGAGIAFLAGFLYAHQERIQDFFHEDITKAHTEFQETIQFKRRDVLSLRFNSDARNPNAEKCRHLGGEFWFNAIIRHGLSAIKNYESNDVEFNFGRNHEGLIQTPCYDRANDAAYKKEVLVSFCENITNHHQELGPLFDQAKSIKHPDTQDKKMIELEQFYTKHCSIREKENPTFEFQNSKP